MIKNTFSPCPYCDGRNDNCAGCELQAYRSIGDIRQMEDIKTGRAAWIPVSERLPRHTGHVLVLSTDPVGELQVNISAFLRDKGWREPYECFFKHDTITHWMPLPEPPREEPTP